ncbi:MAG TPA: hypothetical protein EYM36_05135 [Acidobacteria bacterium]|nr:hypothetical protein [Acidobacteriota bacterium]
MPRLLPNPRPPPHSRRLCHPGHPGHPIHPCRPGHSGRPGRRPAHPGLGGGRREPIRLRCGSARDRGSVRAIVARPDPERASRCSALGAPPADPREPRIEPRRPTRPAASQVPGRLPATRARMPR